MILLLFPRETGLTSMYQVYLLHKNSIRDAGSGRKEVQVEAATHCDEGFVLHLPFCTEAEAGSDL